MPAATPAVVRVALPDVLSGGIQMHWFEVIAIVQGVCEAILQTVGNGESTAPPLQRMLLTSLGAVEITAGARIAGSPIVVVRQLLEAALPENKPVQLRLLLLDINSPVHTGTLRQLTAALEYFERPGRSDLIRAVVDRYLAQRAMEPEKPEPKKIDEPEEDPAEAWRFGARRAGLRLAVAVLVVAAAVVVGSGFWWLVRGHEARAAAAGSERVSTLITTTRSTVTQGLQTLGEQFGFVPSPSGRPAQAEAVDAQPVAGRKRAREAGAGRGSPKAPSKSEGEVPVAARLRSYRGPGDPIPLARGAARSRHVADDGADHGTDTKVYDSANADVIPPIELWPRYPELPAETPRAEIAVFDLVVDEAGQVASARARTPLKRWDHIMLLSAMKSWRFEPATRDGQAVKYRKEVLVRAPRFWW